MRGILVGATCLLFGGVLAACSDVLEPEPFVPDGVTARLVSDTEAALEAYWSGAMPFFSANEYRPPDEVVFYDNQHEPDMQGCPVRGPEDWVWNSLYCPPDETLYLNPDLFALLGENLSTPALGGVVIHAHEFGHHVSQVDAGDFFTPTIGGELQADCYAGAFLAAVQDGQVTIPSLGEFHMFDAMETIRRLGDETVDWDDDVHWFDPKAHGGPAQRAYAMALGFISSDPGLCQAYEPAGPIDSITVGSYEFTPPPATRVATFGDRHIMLTDTFPTLSLTVSPATVAAADATTALGEVIPVYFAGSPITRVEEPNNFVQLSGLSSASFRYEAADGRAHGVLVLATRGDGTAILLDVSAAGASPDTDGWHPLGDAAFSSLWGVYSPG